MHEYFRKMGTSKKTADESKAVALEVFKEFKRISGGKFVRIENWRDPNSDYIEVDDDEAVKRIKIDLSRRNDSIKCWKDPQPKSSVQKSKKSSSKGYVRHIMPTYALRPHARTAQSRVSEISVIAR